LGIRDRRAQSRRAAFSLVAVGILEGGAATTKRASDSLAVLGKTPCLIAETASESRRFRFLPVRK
jgi:hypothetical protein